VKKIIKKSSFLITLFLGCISLKSQTYTFTNAGAEGREGPTQSDINASYLGTNLEGKVTINTRGIQEWLVPADGNYSLEAYGGQGESADSNYYGGKGAIIKGKFTLQKNWILKIAVGQEANSSNGFLSGGGGGGSFIYYDTGSELQFLTIAGGGGGARNDVDQNGTGGRVEQYGGIGSAGSKISDGTAKNNHLRQGGVKSLNSWGSGGGGVETDGEGDMSYNDAGGKSLLNGLVGGHGNNTAADGGFGGGGSGQGGHGGGGGGGYSGGDGGRVAGGGGSYNSGTDQNNTADANEGHGKVIITFLGSVNEAPVISQGVGPLYRVSSEDTQISWSASELNATDSDTNAAQLSWSLLSSPSNGNAVIDGNGSYPQVFTYQPNANYHGPDSFSVQVSDGDANDSITINLTINPVDDPAVISGDTSGFLLEDSSLTGNLNATDIDGLTDGTYFTISSAPSSGSLSINPGSGQWTYYPNSNTYGDETFIVTVTDDQNFTATQVINLNVISVNDLTTLTGDFNGTSNEDTLIRGDINASDIDGLTDGSYFSISLNPSNGVATIDPVDGNWTYFPYANYFGSDAFTVTITDDQGYTATQIINLAVNPIDDPTVISGDTTASLIEDSPAYGDLNASDNDGLSDGTYFTLSSTPSNGSASIDPASGTWSYSPSANFYGNDSFTITVSDDLNNTVHANHFPHRCPD
jgi:VCBS repeat-containing protein